MFSIERFELVHWDWWQRFAVPLDANIVTIVGPNGSGKTTLLDALRTALAIDCSAGRDYKRYVRRSDKPYAWLRMVVSNGRTARGQLAFWPITTPQVTLFCRIRKKGGDWERSYGIGSGDVPVERAEEADAVTWIGVRQYAAQLEGAGLTRAIKRVLALDQGHTDKLCEYSGQELLKLVFDVFGDQEVLDNYQKARDEQNGAARELDALKTQLARLHTALQAAEADVNSYNDLQRLNGELQELHGQWVPRTRLAELVETLRGGRSQLRGKRREAVEAQRQRTAHRARLATLTAELAAIEQAEQHAKAALEAVQKQEAPLNLALGAAQALLDQRETLVARVAEQADDFDAEAASREVERLRRKGFALEQTLTALDTEKAELDARLAALESGRRPMPAEVAQFRAELDRAGIGHVALAEIVEIADPHWQDAAEAVLAGVRHLLLLEDPADRAAAWRLGEQHRFRHYLVPDRAAPGTARPGSLLECLRFSAHPPTWLLRLLDGIQRVETVEAGARLPDAQAWITPRGYQRERRGARDISVRDSHFGAHAATQTRSRRAQIEAEAQRLRDELAGHLRRLDTLTARLAGIDAAQVLSARQAEFGRAEAERTRLSAEIAAVATQRAAAAQRYYETTQARPPLERSHALSEEAVRVGEQRVRDIQLDLANAQRSYVNSGLALRAMRVNKPAAWHRDAGVAETRARYDSVKAVEHDIERLERRKRESHFVTDPHCVLVRDKLKLDHDQLDARIEQQSAQLERARSTTDRARAQYINVLKATLRRYARNLEKLGALAGIAVEVGYPNLANDDLSLTQAALAVQFNFDQKGLIGLNDGEASGGQQVMKSMILLVGLMMEDEGASGGFVFIDEPFAHLDIFNIDRVGAFLQATQAQYIVTTPNTHNVNVFKPSELTLLTQKRRPGEAHALPVAFLRRARPAG
jgi:chromosome segregation ATPase